MPNWAIGSVDVTGTREAVLAFSDRFITSDEISTVPGRKFFARSFLEEFRESIRGEICEYFKSAVPEEKRSFNLGVMFAWSATSCVISGYPQQNPDECITLSEACVEDCVAVEIHTSETGMSFEEEIICDEDGNCSDIERDLVSYRCPECGEIWCLASFEDPDDYECCECGHEGLIPKEEK